MRQDQYRELLSEQAASESASKSEWIGTGSELHAVFLFECLQMTLSSRRRSYLGGDSV